MPAQRLLGKNFRLKPALLAQLGQRIDIPLRFVSEVKIVTFMDLAGVQSVCQYLARKIIGTSSSTDHG